MEEYSDMENDARDAKKSQNGNKSLRTSPASSQDRTWSTAPLMTSSNLKFEKYSIKLFSLHIRKLARGWSVVKCEFTYMGWAEADGDGMRPVSFCKKPFAPCKISPLEVSQVKDGDSVVDE